MSDGPAGGERPADIRAFLIADVRGYTAFTAERGDEAAAALTVRFAELVAEAVELYGGRLTELRGDEALVTFTSARQAVRAALDLQRLCVEHSGARPDLPIQVGIGVDAGEAVPVLGGYRGQALNLAARLCGLAGGGEVLITESLAHLAGRIEGVTYAARGSVQVKGFAEPVEVVGVETADRARAQSGGIEPAASGEAQRLPIGAFLGALPAVPLIGRDAELERILGAVDAAAAGSGRLLALAGEPGAGKTRLAQEATLVLRNRGFHVGIGAALESRQEVPYFAFLDLLPGLLDLHRRLGGAAGNWPYLARLVGATAGGPEPSSEADEERLRREAGVLVAELARVRPVALLLDDLHWADGSSLELLHHLARHLRGEPVLLLATYRDVEVRRDHPLEQLLRGLRREDLAEMVPVRRLRQDGTRALMATTFGVEEVSDEFAGLVHDQTDGNPFFVQQVLKALVERGDVYREGDTWERRELAEIEIPESIRSTIGERVTRLPEATQECLRAAAVLGQRFRFDDLVAMVDLDEEALEAALDAAATSGMLRSQGADAYAFEHALAQQTLLAEVSLRRRRRLHSRAAATLAERAGQAPERAAEIAYHYLEADQAAEAARWSLAAGEYALSVVALPEAESHLRRAAELASEEGHVGQRARALYLLGQVLRIRGRPEAAIEALAGSAHLFAGLGNLDGEAFAIAEMTRVEVLTAGAAPAVDRIDAFLRRAGAGLDPEARATLLVTLSRAAFWADQPQRMLDAAAEAEAVAAAAGLTGLQAEAIGRRALALAQLESFQAAVAVYHEAFAVEDETVPVDVRSINHNNYAFCEFSLGHFELNRRHRRISADLAGPLVEPAIWAFATVMVGQAYHFVGELDRAREYIVQARSHLQAGDPSRGRAYVDVQEGATEAAAGDLDAAERLLRLGVSVGHEHQDRQISAWAASELAQVLLARGRTEEARELLEEEYGLGASTQIRFGLDIVMGEVERRCGMLDEAEQRLRSTLAACRAFSDLREAAEALATLGAVLVTAGRHEEGETALEEATRLAAQMPYPWVVARATLERARSLVSRGRVEAGRSALAEAAGVIDEHGFGGLRPRLEEVDQLASAPGGEADQTA